MNKNSDQKLNTPLYIALRPGGIRTRARGAGPGSAGGGILDRGPAGDMGPPEGPGVSGLSIRKI